VFERVAFGRWPRFGRNISKGARPHTGPTRRIICTTGAVTAAEEVEAAACSGQGTPKSIAPAAVAYLNRAGPRR
jgi:hypothetical protein